MKKLLMLIPITLLLAGCGMTATLTPPVVKEVNIPDGRSIFCVVIGEGESVAISCDWGLQLPTLSQ